MSGAVGFRELEVWRKAMDLATEIYRIAGLMPKQEEYRLTAQLVRAAISIPANIAEGHARGTRKDYAHFVSIARGPVAELDTLLELAARADLIAPERLQTATDQVEHVARMLNRLHARLRESAPKSPIPNPQSLKQSPRGAHDPRS